MPYAFEKLRDDVTESHKNLDPQRRQRLKVIREYVGTHYGPSGAGRSVPVNLIELATNIFMQHLVPGTPQATVTSNHLGFRDSAESFQYALNEMILRIDLEETMRSAVMEALFCMGIIKVGVTDEERHEFDGFMHDGNLPFADVVDFDDWVHDTSARRWEQCKYMGNRYESSIEDIESNDENDKEAVKALKDDWLSNKHRDTAASLSQRRSVADQEKDSVWLWDIWVPREKMVYVFGEGEPNKPLRKVEWDGPPNGPFIKLGFGVVPSNVVPLAPAANWHDLHDLANNLYNKLGEQSRRQKTVGLVSGAAIEDGRRTIRARDGEMIPTTTPDSVREMRFGGADQNTLTFAMHVVDRFSYGSGNLDVIGGLGAQADTLGQERLLASSANQRVLSMQHNVVKFTRDVMYNIGWWMWNDPLVQIPVIQKIKGTEIEVQTDWPYQIDGMGGETDIRRGEYNDYNIKIEPYSMSNQSPAEKLAMLRRVWAEDILPIAQMLQEQGVPVDGKAYLETLAKYASMPELERILGNQIQVMPEEKPAVNRTPQAPNTSRTYNRRDVRPKPSNSEKMMDSLMKRPQSDNAA